MRRAELSGWAPWVFCSAVLVMAALTFARPETVPYSLFVVPVLACSVLGRRALTVLVASLTLVLGVAILAIAQYTDLPPWRRMLIVVLAIAVSFAATWTIATARQRLQEQADRYRLLAENIVDAVISIRPEGPVTWASPSITGILGYTPEELVGRTMSDLLDRSGTEQAGAGTPAFVPHHDQTQVLLLHVKAGATVRVEATTRAMRDDAGDITGFVIAMRDVEEQARTREALVHEQEFDGLTGLAKRGLALERIAEVLAGRPHGNWGLLCVGVNGLTTINHAYTHRGGDAVLQSVGDRLVTAAGAHDRVARIAGDEFVVIQPDITDETTAALAAENLLEAVRGPVLFDQTPIHVTASVGVAMSHGLDAEALLSDTTAAMRDAALLGPDRWAFVQGDVGARTREAMLLQSSLRDALAAGHLVPWFMPVVSLADDSLGGYEALVRWVHEDGSVTMPDEFLPLAEKAGLSADVDRAVFSAVLARSARMPSHLEFGINVSAATLATPGFSRWMTDDVLRSGVEPRRLHLEVTETALFRVVDETVREMQAVAELGLSWWVDDFGTGFSSISHLRDLPIAGLKLDRSFTSDVAVEGSRAARLAEGLAGLAEGLGLSTVAEGVETAEQARALHHLGWMFGQGWHYGKAAPLPAA
jgi:PAS domain S-box-containing protein/diguanylate cyclase (GGDEF)-like protein